MDLSSHHQRGMYFEEFEVGQRVVSPGRTVTEADVVGFAGLSGDFTAIHTDAEYARQTVFEQRVAHGLLGMAIASGLLVRSGLIEGTVIAFREINKWKFSQPMFIGDTVHVEVEVAECKPLPRLGGGSVDLILDLKKQDGKSVMKGRWTVLVQNQPTS
jgi:3-hydroxybutyryl-CoA dehydratase